MIEKNLLYLNLSVDSKDTSLGFCKTWISIFLINFENVDICHFNAKQIIENNEYLKNVKIYGIDKDNQVIQKLININKLKNIIKKLTHQNNYDLCFSHMSPLL